MAEAFKYGVLVLGAALLLALKAWIGRGIFQRLKDQIDRERRFAELTPIVDHEDLSR
jgi:hypothetical protein